VKVVKYVDENNWNGLGNAIYKRKNFEDADSPKYWDYTTKNL